MKGTLHKTENGWHVSYYIMRETSHAIHPNEHTLPLIDNGHIDGLKLYDSNEGLEVEFEVIEFPVPPTNGPVSNSISKYAKLVSKEYLVNAPWLTMKEGDLTVNFKPIPEFDEPAYPTRLVQLREQVWEEIIREFYRDAQKVPIGAPPLMIECWLAENYNPPTKKQD